MFKNLHDALLRQVKPRDLSCHEQYQEPNILTSWATFDPILSNDQPILVIPERLGRHIHCTGIAR